MFDECFQKACETAVKSLIGQPKNELSKQFRKNSTDEKSSSFSLSETDLSLDSGDQDFSVKSLFSDFDNEEFVSKYFVEQ